MSVSKFQRNENEIVLKMLWCSCSILLITVGLKLLYIIIFTLDSLNVPISLFLEKYSASTYKIKMYASCHLKTDLKTS